MKICNESIKGIKKVADYLGNSGAIDIKDVLYNNLNIIENKLNIMENDLNDTIHLNDMLMSAVMYYEEILQQVEKYQQNIKDSLNTETNNTLYKEVSKFLELKFDVDEQLKENL